MADRYSQSQLDSIMKPTTSLVLEQDPLLSMLQSKGRIKYGKSGDRLSKDYVVDAHGIKSYGRLATHVASEKGDYIRAYWPWGGVYDDDYLAGWDTENQGAEGSLATGTIRDIRNEAITQMRENFTQRFREQVWAGDGASLNGGTGVTILGITQAVPDSPSTGTYAGLSRVTYTGWRSRTTAGASGPSNSWTADCWERVLTSITQCSRTPMDGESSPKPDMLFCDFTNYVQLLNRALTQNTALDTEIKGITTLLGMRLEQSENISGKVYTLNSKSIEISSTHPTGVLFRMHYKKDLEDHIDENDEVLVMRFKGQCRVLFPAANGVITSAS